MITRMQVFPLGAGKSVIKSTPRCDNERPGMGRGRSLPDGRWRGSLEIVHSSGNIGMIWRAPRWSTFTVGSFKDLLINNPLDGVDKKSGGKHWFRVFIDVRGGHEVEIMHQIRHFWSLDDKRC